MSYKFINKFLLIGFCFLINVNIFTGCTTAKTNIPIVISQGADPVTRLAAEELSTYLGKIYLEHKFNVTSSDNFSQKVIKLGTTQTLNSSDINLQKNGAFSISHRGENNQEIASIIGKGSRGTLNAVYALLEKLGYGFYLSYETKPKSRSAFNFKEWEMSDVPLVEDRIVFNWHNFISSATTWNLKQWKQYISNSSKMGFNTIMVHAYGNNPMYNFTYNGEKKPIGYLANTAKGRDWGTPHVNDVRRMYGGEVYADSIFGSSASKVPEKQRGEAAVSLMQQVFSYAKSRGVDVNFGIDVGSRNSNPKNIIKTLPKSARYQNSRDYELVNPDTPEGYNYYRAQVVSLIKKYPEINRITLWFRQMTDLNSDFTTPLRAVRYMDLPTAWKQKYGDLLDSNPVLANNPEQAPSLFALSKIIKAWRKAINELGHPDIKLAIGSWDYNFIKRANPVIPKDIDFISLLSSFQEDQPEIKKVFTSAPDRKVVPVLWSHNDDRAYIGRPNRPVPNFGTVVSKRNYSGFAIIHWTTRPLDLYFKNLSQQVWQTSSNEDLNTTVKTMAHKTIYDKGSIFANYLNKWINDAPIFGRETSNYFIDQPLKYPEKTIRKAKQRVNLLQQIQPGSIQAQGQSWLSYYKGMEDFFVDFYQTQAKLEKSDTLLKNGNRERAINTLRKAKPQEVIKKYSSFSQSPESGITRGEKGLVVSLNLRWLPDFIDLRQRLRLKDICYNFHPTNHESLAQASGKYTFYIDKKNRFYRSMGKKEVGGGQASFIQTNNQPTNEIYRSYVATRDPLSFSLKTFREHPLSSGKYEVELLLGKPENSPSTKSTFSIKIEETGNKLANERVNYSEQNKRYFTKKYQIQAQGENIQLSLIPRKGKAYIFGMVIHPINNGNS